MISILFLLPIFINHNQRTETTIQHSRNANVWWGVVQRGGGGTNKYIDRFWGTEGIPRETVNCMLTTCSQFQICASCVRRQNEAAIIFYTQTQSPQPLSTQHIKTNQLLNTPIHIYSSVRGGGSSSMSVHNIARAYIRSPCCKTQNLEYASLRAVSMFEIIHPPNGKCTFKLSHLNIRTKCYYH